MRQPDHDQIVAALRTASRFVAGADGTRTGRASLACLLDSAVGTIAGATAGGIARIEPDGVLRTTHATSDDVRLLDRVQADLAEGPSLTVADDPPPTGIVLADDLGGRDARRWPRFAPAAVRSGYRSMMSVRLSLDRGRRGVLALCSPAPGVFGAGARLAAGLFGLQAAMLLHEPGPVPGPRAGAGRPPGPAGVERATGIVMERYTLDEDDAARWLRRAAGQDGMTVPEFAAVLVDEAGSHARIGDSIRDTLEALTARFPDPGADSDTGPGTGDEPAAAGRRDAPPRRWLRLVRTEPDDERPV
ncbi:ANTAR domain-containing protein [Pseudonocardia sp. NPDC046786]|uniref:ANTAR domain-containing protein n=1 Tax=Pseudonocardia sp. NPDC046786 TaxID=3155471 RepID=UPI0033EA2B96